MQSVQRGGPATFTVVGTTIVTVENARGVIGMKVIIKHPKNHGQEQEKRWQENIL